MKEFLLICVIGLLALNVQCAPIEDEAPIIPTDEVKEVVSELRKDEIPVAIEEEPQVAKDDEVAPVESLRSIEPVVEVAEPVVAVKTIVEPVAEAIEPVAVKTIAEPIVDVQEPLAIEKEQPAPIEATESRNVVVEPIEAVKEEQIVKDEPVVVEIPALRTISEQIVEEIVKPVEALKTVEPLVEVVEEEVVAPIESLRSVAQLTEIAEPIADLKKIEEPIVDAAVEEKIVEPVESLRIVEPVIDIEESAPIVKENVETVVPQVKTVAEVILENAENSAPVVDVEPVPVQNLRNIAPVADEPVSEIKETPVQVVEEVVSIIKTLPDGEQVQETIIEQIIPEQRHTEIVKEIVAEPEVAEAVKEVLVEEIIAPGLKVVEEVIVEEKEVVPVESLRTLEKLEEVQEPVVVEKIEKIEEVLPVQALKTVAEEVVVEEKPVEIINLNIVKSVPIVEEIAPIVDVEHEPVNSVRGGELKEDATTARPNLIQQIIEPVSNFLQNNPISQAIANRQTTQAPAGDVAQDDAATTARPNIFQQAVQNTQNFVQGILNPNANNAVVSAEATTARPNIIQQVQSAVGGIFSPQSGGSQPANPIQGVIQGIQNFINPTTATAPAANPPAADEEIPAAIDSENTISESA